MKQVIVMRRDIGMRKGKMCAQAAHASVKSIADGLGHDRGYNPIVEKWLEDGMSKVVLSCNSENELLMLAGQASTFGIITALIQDAGLTQIEPGTYTCVAIGPDEDHIVDELTGHLKLL